MLIKSILTSCRCSSPCFLFLVAAFVGARSYSSDSFTCTQIDPATGVPVTRSLNLFIGCNAGGKPTDALQVSGYYEQGQCQYYIIASHKRAFPGRARHGDAPWCLCRCPCAIASTCC